MGGEMACPYFYPVRRLAGDASTRSAMLPLGDAWTGLCFATPGGAPPTDSGPLGTFCSLGYARGACPRFPDHDSGADAVRFAISRDDGISIDLTYVLERNHHPFAYGPLRYSFDDGRFLGMPSAKVLERQAQAYVESYLRRKKEASTG